MACHLSQSQRVRILYKAILRLHRGLPAELRELGDNYTKDEFKRHKKCNEAEATLFMTEWTKYALTLSEQMGLRGKAKSKIGEPVSEDDLQSLRDEQVVQLYELLLAAKGEPSDPDPQGGGATTARKKQE